MRFRTLHKDGVPPADADFTERLKATCQGHLVWVFKIAAIRPNDTWQSDYDHFVSETKYKSSKPPTDASPISRVVEGAFQFSKLWLYLSAWPQDWEFVLDLLYLRLGDWLQYLRKNQHMENLWIEHQSSLTLKPYDTIPPFGYTINQTFPRYHLSDSTMLWLAFRQLECLFDHIKSRSTCSEEVKLRILVLQEKFESYRDVCSIPKLRSKILETFTVSEQKKPTSRYLGAQLTELSPEKTKVDQRQAGVSIGFTEGAASDPQRQPYVQMEEKFISPDTLEAYGLPWKRNLRDPSYIIVNRWIDETDKQILFQHTRMLRGQKHNLSTALVPLRTGGKSNPAVHKEIGLSDRRVLAFGMSVNENILEMSMNDLATIEAATIGFFKDEKGQDVPAWQETLLSHKIRDSRSFDHPREIALILLASKFGLALATNANYEPDGYYLEKLAAAFCDTGDVRPCLADETKYSGLTEEGFQTLSLVLAIYFEECRLVSPVLDEQRSDPPPYISSSPQPSRGWGGKPLRRMSVVIPQEIGAYRNKPAIKILDTVFLPRWMYHYPDFIHDQALDVNIRSEIAKIEKVFNPIVASVKKWEEFHNFSETFSRGISSLGDLPCVADCGIKRAANLTESSSPGHNLDIGRYWDSRLLYERLLMPRTFKQGKKRLIEIPSHNLDNALICWLTVPSTEKPFFEDFVNSHLTRKCLFGERVDWRGNIWETELHLGFFQLLTHKSIHDELLALRRVKSIPSLQGSFDRGEVGLVATSLRIVGDLQDRSWTCHFFTSVSRENRYTGVLDEFMRGSTRGSLFEDLFSDKIGQRRILEMSYMDEVFKEIEGSSEEIIMVFQDELNVRGAQNVQSQSYEFIRDYSQLHQNMGEILRDVLRQFNTALAAIGEWEGREESRGFPSRWTDKDEKRHGEKLRNLNRKCKVSIQHLRAQKGRLEEQLQLAEQRHNNLITYLQLQDARTSSQSAEDVRLFTYVTIVFLPLTFASSLFSMQGAPTANTISVMVQTTVVALVVTVLVLGNMKLLNRNWSYRMSKFGLSTRAKMLAPGNRVWEGRARELETAAQLRPSNPENQDYLPAESKWHYLWFWLWYAVRQPRYYVIDGLDAWRDRRNRPKSHKDSSVKLLSLMLMAPISILVFILPVLFFNFVDMLALIRMAMGWLWHKLWRLLLKDSDPPKEGTLNNASTETPEVTSTSSGLPYSQHKHRERIGSSADLNSPGAWLLTTPRPLQRILEQSHPQSSSTSAEMESRLSDDHRESFGVLHREAELDDDDGLELALDQNELAIESETSSNIQALSPMQHEPEDGVDEVKRRWWHRLRNKRRSGPEI
ncbi:MAG: hypothetical protein Q9193_002082 [Seirophora villosa]